MANKTKILRGRVSGRKYEFYGSESEAKKEIAAYKHMAKVAGIKLPKIERAKGVLIAKPKNLKGKAARLFKDFGE